MYSYAQDIAYRINNLTAVPMGQDMADAILQQLHQFELDKPQAEACSRIVEILVDLWSGEEDEDGKHLERRNERSKS
jgi:hypothetical protein